MASRSTEELTAILQSLDYSEDARLAAQWELDNRSHEVKSEKVTLDLPGERAYEEVIHSFPLIEKSSFFSKPKYKLSRPNGLPITEAREIAIAVIHKLQWKLRQSDESVLSALRANEQGIDTEFILIGIGPENIMVQSQSLRRGHVDFGQNSIRVQLFFHVYEELARNRSKPE